MLVIILYALFFAFDILKNNTLDFCPYHFSTNA